MVYIKIILAVSTFDHCDKKYFCTFSTNEKKNN